MSMDKGEKLKSLSKEDILEYYDSVEDWEKAIEKCQPYNLAVESIRDKTKRLEIAREWLESKDSSLFFKDPEESEEN
jgi:lipopolysaccharide biosynthesis regulator YciM